ncbi:hypothetical protein MHY87_02555 [Microvirga sp. ACRRW]|uniref:hypothetical protein n=1 Tax=Microvirga sp. ACRRW TaxID=2918205 RepID=UPI001EF52730|nr:hypothetical protein [Microvirga sp. ACRRW]MCG7391787.1 hypothetical protein [Microvirga sp. ACRRW]
MEVGRFMAAAGFGLVISVAASDAKAQGAPPGFQGAWLSGDKDCAEVYASTGKGASFKRPVDIFAPAFIIAGNRLRTPQATCRIKSAKPAGDRRLLILSCANAVSDDEVRVLVAAQPDGSLKRFFNEQDEIGTAYRQCSR